MGGSGKGGTGGREPPPPLKKNTKYRVSLQYWSGSLEKSQKLPSQHSMLGNHRHANETPFKWRFAGGPIMAWLSLYLDHIYPIKLKKKIKKKLSNLDPLWQNFLDPRMQFIRVWYLMLATNQYTRHKCLNESVQMHSLATSFTARAHRIRT